MRLRPLLWMSAIAASHFALSTYQGMRDGDYSLAYFAIPFAALTLVGGVAMTHPHQWGATIAIILSALTVVAALMSVGLYLLGAFHLLQSLGATVYSARECARRSATMKQLEVN